jgi:hypothetical protein
MLCVALTLDTSDCVLVDWQGVFSWPLLSSTCANWLLVCWPVLCRWLMLAVSCIADTIRQGIPFNLGWWGSGGCHFVASSVVWRQLVSACCKASNWMFTRT